MARLKRRQDEQYPEKRQISKQKLRGNAVGFKKEINIDDDADQDNTNGGENASAANGEWANEMKINFVKD